MLSRLAQIIVIATCAIFMLGADSSTTQLDHISHKLVCQCGCGQILGECNHVGCPVSPVMLSEVRTRIDSGLNEKSILQFMIDKYGPIALAAPIRGGFDNVAWIVPIAAALLCAVGIIWLLRVWKRRSAALPSVPFAQTTDSDLAERIRRETTYDDFGGPAR